MARGRRPAKRMARGGRTRPQPRQMARGGRARGRKMPGGGRTCGGMNQPPCPGGGGGYRKGGRTRPAPRGRGRKFQAGGHGHDAHTHPYQAPSSTYGSSGVGWEWGHKHMMGNQQSMATSASLNMGQGSHQHPSGIPRPPRPGGVIPGRKRGGRVTHQLRRGGRPAPRGRGRKMARGGSFQGGGQSVCPAGTDRTADGRCTPMGS